MGQIQALQDEMVVYRVPGGIVAVVVERDLGEWHVSHCEVEPAGREACALKAFGPNVGVGVERGGDAGGGGVELDADDFEREALWSEADEVARPASRLEHLPAAKSETDDRTPHRGHDLGGCVMRIDSGSSGRVPCRLIKETPQLGTHVRPLCVAVVEDSRKRPPSRPPSQQRLLRHTGLVAFGVQVGQHPERSQVRLRLGLRPGRRQVALTSGAEVD